MAIPCRQKSANAGILAGEDPQETRMNITNVALLPNGGGVVAAVQHGEWGVWKRRATLARTTDRGETWQTLAYPFPADTILALSFSSPRDGIVYGLDVKHNSVVSVTGDGGRNWKRGTGPADFDQQVRRLAPNTDRIRVDSTVSFRLVRDMIIDQALLSKDPDHFMTPKLSEEMEAMKNRALEGRRHIWSLLKSTDGGERWDTLLSSIGDETERVRFFNNRYGVLMTGEYMMITKDQGAHWRYQPFIGAWGGAEGTDRCDPFILQDFIFVDERTLCEFYFGWARFIRLE
jgi:hypothetical protein